MKIVYGIIGFFVFIVFLIVAISLGNNISDTPVAKTQTAVTTIKAAEYSSSSSEVVLTLTGPVTADERHYSVRMKVNANQRVVELIKGYQGNIEKTKSYANNPAAYDAFLKALDGGGFMSERSTSKDKMNNESTACFVGTRYAFDLTTIAKAVGHRWSTSCFDARGNFGGDIGSITQLFRNQIPDYAEIVNGSGFYY
jgi:hypothetical protein